MAGNGPILEAAGIVRDFAGTRALDHVSMTLGRGEVHAVVGENGAGKSTLVKVLAGSYRPDSGTLRVDGHPVRFASPRDAERAGISALHQQVNLVPQMSVARNLFLGREPRRRGLIHVARMNELADTVVTGFDLHIDVRRPLASFDCGIRQMVAVARAASAGRSVVIMDEPTAGLETGDIDRLYAAIERLRAAGRSVIYVSHRLPEIERICDRVSVLRDGRLVHTGPLAGLSRLRLVSLMLGRRMATAAGSPAPDPSTPAPTPAHPVPGAGTLVLGGAAEPADPPVLRATGLTRRYILTDVSLNLRSGEVVGLSGLLGAGRSETAKAIAGAIPLDSGQVTVSGRHLRRRSIIGAIRAGVGLLPQNRTAEGIIATLSVRDNIALAALPRLARAGIVSEARLDRIVAAFMTRIKIKATSPNQPAAELSGGNQQKVLLARWMAMNPRVLMLDEPTRGIDIGTKAEVQALIDDLAVEGLAVLLISSDLDELVDTCDRIVVLRDGAVVRQLGGGDLTEKNLMSLLAAG